MTNDMTMAEVLRDPLIRQMLRADGISLSDFASLLQNAARQKSADRNAALLAADRMPYFVPARPDGCCVALAR